MKAGTVYLAAFFALCALIGTVWLGRTSGNLPVKESQRTDSHESELPPIAESGPYPKAVTEETEYEFGVMEVGQQQSHSFVIRNEGEAPLVLQKGETSCECTLSQLENQQVPPGESAEVTLSWKARKVSEGFRQRATIHTNDPEHQRLTFGIFGRVRTKVSVVPQEGWNVGELPDNEPTTVTGQIYSAVLEDFELLDVRTSSPYLEVKTQPLSKEKREELQAKSGYAIEVILIPQEEMPIGRYQGEVTIETDVRDGATFTLPVTGRRSGPIRILPTFGVEWNSSAMRLNLGRFPSEKGQQATLSLFVSGLGEKPLQFRKIVTDPTFLKVSLEADPNFQAPEKQRYRLTFDVPPGSPASSRLGPKPATVQVETNHPQVEQLEFTVLFVSN